MPEMGSDAAEVLSEGKGVDLDLGAV